MKKLFIICGLIGSGKTTYAKSNFSMYTDLDNMHDYATKKQQIDWTHKLLKFNDNVAHITTFPTDEEIEMAKMYNSTFVLVDTSLDQCKTNILIRDRESDIRNLINVLKSNIDYYTQFNTSKIAWNKIKIF